METIIDTPKYHIVITLMRMHDTLHAHTLHTQRTKPKTKPKLLTTVLVQLQLPSEPALGHLCATQVL